MNTRLAQFVFWIWMVLVCASTGSTWGRVGGGPENLILAVNQNSPASLAVANLYIRLRDIPPSHVVYLDLPFAADQEQITLAEFREHILRPILEQVRARRLESQIDYIVYSADFPTAVTINEMLQRLQKAQPELTAEQLKVFRPVASINAVTYFAAAILEDNPSFIGLTANWYMRLPLDNALMSPFDGDDDRSYRSAQVKIHTGEYAAALEFLRPLAEAHPRQFAVRVEIVRCHAGLGQTADTAIALIELARTGFSHRDTIIGLAEFAKVADDKGVQAALKTIGEDPCPYLSTQSFHSRHIWGKNGGVNGAPAHGRNYILSTVLAVTRNNGISLADALAAIERNALVDATQPTGEFFFSLNGDVRTKTRQPGFEHAIAGLKHLGFTGAIIKDRVPQRQKRVMGALLGDKAIAWPPSLSQMVPGAIVDNLTSFGGRMKGDHHTLATEFIKWGAAGSSGTVVEPFAIQAKFAHPMIFVHYARGCSLAEAYYQSVHGPFQLLIVGDALCQPWAKPVPFTVTGLEPGGTARGTVQLKMKPESNMAVDHYEIFLDGVRSQAMPRTGQVSFDAAQIPDGFHELRIVAVAPGPIEFQSRQIIPFLVDNDGLAVELELAAAEVALTDEVALTVRGPSSAKFEIRQHGRLLAEVAQSGETLKIPASRLGTGTSSLVAVALGLSEKVQSRPVEVRVR